LIWADCFEYKLKLRLKLVDFFANLFHFKHYNAPFLITAVALLKYDIGRNAASAGTGTVVVVSPLTMLGMKRPAWFRSFTESWWSSGYCVKVPKTPTRFRSLA